MEAQEIQKQYYDSKVNPAKTYKVGEQVLLKVDEDIPGKFNMRWKGPYTVLEKKSEVNYKLLTPKGKEYVTHVDGMKKCNSEKQLDPTKTEAATAAEARVDEIVTDPTIAVTKSRTQASATNSLATDQKVVDVQNDQNTTQDPSLKNKHVTGEFPTAAATETTAKDTDSTTTATNAGAKIAAPEVIHTQETSRAPHTINQEDLTVTITGAKAKVAASKTAVTNAGAKVEAPIRILTRKIIFPRKYKDFVVNTRKN